MQRDLDGSLARDVSADWRFNIASNAALQSAKAALAAAGYRIAKNSRTGSFSKSLSRLSPESWRYQIRYHRVATKLAIEP